MPVEVNKETIRIRVELPEKFIAGSFRTIIIDEAKGISSVVGKLKGGEGSMVPQNFMFKISKGWTESDAKKWVKDHGHTIKSLMDSPDEFTQKAIEYISKNNIETKNLAIVREFNHFEVKSLNQTDSAGSIRIKGYLSTFENTDRQNDVVLPTAFDETIKGLKKLPMLRDHVNMVDCQIGSWDTFIIDKKGLYVEGVIERTEKTEHLIALVKGGHLDTISMGGLFKYNDRPDVKGRNVLAVATVLEGSVVVIPANAEATFTMKSFFKSGVVADTAKSSKVEKLVKLIESEELPEDHREVCRKILEELEA